MPSHAKGSAVQMRALDAFIKLMRAANSASAVLQHNLDTYDLTVSQFGVLEALFHRGPMSLSELGRKILRSGGNMTLVASNLEKRGLVRRDRSSEDRRVMHMMLTAKGERLIQAVWPRHVELLVQGMSVLAPAEQEELARLCKKLGMAQSVALKA